MNNIDRQLNVLMMPDYRPDNPYQSLLQAYLEKIEVQVSFPVGYHRVFPVFRHIKSLKYSIDILHLHWLNPFLKGENLLVKIIYSLKFFLDIYLVKSQKIKVVWTIHNFISHNAQFPKLEQWVQSFFLKRLADQVIVHSQSARDIVAHTYRINPNDLIVIPHGNYRDVYPPAIAQQTARQKLNLSATGLIFLNFGMLRPYKGIEKLFQIWHSQPEIYDHHLLVVGKALDSAYSEKLAVVAKKLLNVDLRDDFIPNEEIHLYFSAADVIVLPFNQILTSGSLLLAMSYGKPIIAPRLSSIIETLDHATDFLYDPEDETGLLKAIQLSINSDLKIASQKVLQAGDRLDWNTIAQQTKKVYLS